MSLLEILKLIMDLYEALMAVLDWIKSLFS